MPRPPAPSVRDDAAVARGKALFEGTDLSCDACHLGDRLTDQSRHPIGSGPMKETDTPSLVGLAHSGPYYHDGSAVNLHALLGDRATVHGMADFGELSPTQIDDLVAYLETL